MKRISLTNDELAALEDALIEFGAVVTFDQLSEFFAEDRQYTRIRIKKLVEQGWLKRIKKGVFVVSDLSSRGSLSISHLAVANILVRDAYISFETALQHHGLFDQLHTTVNNISRKQFKTTTIDSITYNFIKTQERYFYGWQTYDIDGRSVKVADSEKAIIDLLQFHRTLYSTDLAFEKLRDFQHVLEHEKLVGYGQKANLTTQRILGFLMDCVGLDTSALLASVVRGRSVSAISDSEENLYNHKWRLYYDQHLERWIDE